VRDDRPNILLIYPDQMRADAMGCAGNGCISTPNIDTLADGGVRFENAFTSFPLCSPFRASLMTGKYAHSAGMCANHYPIPLDQDFLAAILRDNGYRTGYFGKWHLNGGWKHSLVPKTERLGFETFVGFSRGHEYFDSIFYRNDDPTPRTSRRYEADYQTDHLIEFMKACSSDPAGRPFFGMVSYGIPHPPLVAPEKYLTMYLPGGMPLSPNTPDGEFSVEARKFLAEYYGLVTCVDDNVGRLMSFLDETGLAGNTLVLLVSDHGELAGEHGRYSKKIYYRNSMQVPMIVRYPKRFSSDTVVSHLVDPSVDTMPTLLELCGLPVPEAVQGTSYLPLLEGSPTPTRDAIHYKICMEKEGPENFPVPERGIRTHDWVYVRTEDGPKALFDLNADPLEMNNLVESVEHQETMASLDTRVLDHMARTADRWDIQAEFPPPNFQSHEDGARYCQELLRKAIVED
jgi:arylsulfatase A-like enzyme